MDWIFEVGDKLKQRNLTIHIACAYLERLMHEYEISGNKLELTALTSLLIASKYDELDDNIPLIKEI